MATRFLLKMQRDPKLSLELLRNPISILTRPISPIAQLESPQLSLNKASSFSMILGMSKKPFAGVGNGGFSLPGSGTLFARQMGTGRSSTSSKSRGSPSRDDEDDDSDDDFDDVDVHDFDDEEMDDDDDDFGDEDFDDDIEEEENPKRKKANGRN